MAIIAFKNKIKLSLLFIKSDSNTNNFIFVLLKLLAN